MKVKDLMTKTPYCCMQTDTVQHAAELMKSNDVGALPVVTDCAERKLVGIVTDRDICLKIVGLGKHPTSRVSEAMTRAVASCHIEDTIESCEAKMEDQQVRRIPVVISHGVCIGIVSQADVALHDSPAHLSCTVAAISRPHARSHISARVVSPAAA